MINKNNITDIKQFLENDYPLTIVKDRYSGAYSGGEYCAFPLLYFEMPQEVSGNDKVCSSYWSEEDNLPYLVGIGSTPEEAWQDLHDKYTRQAEILLKDNLAEVCEIAGHDYRYNYPNIPTKCICARCHRKWIADYSGDIIHKSVWKEVDTFDGNRSDEDMIANWH